MKHYKQRQRESIEIIKDALTDEQLKGFLLGNIYKYLNRYEYKDDPQGDLYKAAKADMEMMMEALYKPVLHSKKT